jgi:hypothetical protein
MIFKDSKLRYLISKWSIRVTIVLYLPQGRSIAAARTRFLFISQYGTAHGLVLVGAWRLTACSPAVQFNLRKDYYFSISRTQKLQDN